MKSMMKLTLGAVAALAVTVANAQTPAQVRGPFVAESGRGPVPELTRQEALAKAMERFDRADTNKDGKLSLEERKAAHEMMRAKMQERRARHQAGREGKHPLPETAAAPR